MSHPESPKGVDQPLASSLMHPSPASMPITVLQCLAPQQVQEWIMALPIGTTAQQALIACGLWPTTPAPAGWLLGIWGRRCSLQTVLQSGDRLEIYRGLKVDPKVARRERFKGQGARTAGLFARRRPGAKPGY